MASWKISNQQFPDKHCYTTKIFIWNECQGDLENPLVNYYETYFGGQIRQDVMDFYVSIGQIFVLFCLMIYLYLGNVGSWVYYCMSEESSNFYWPTMIHEIYGVLDQGDVDSSIANFLIY